MYCYIHQSILTWYELILFLHHSDYSLRSGKIETDNVPQITMGKQFSSLRMALIPFILRDVLFRTVLEGFYHSMVFYAYYSRLSGQRKLGIHTEDTLVAQFQHDASQTTHKRSGLFLLNVTVATVISNPLDMITIRLTIQHKQSYSGMIDCAKTIMK